MKKLDYKILLFDLDGTLIDSGEGIMKCAQYSLAHFGIEVTDLNSLRPFVGPPLEDSFKMFYGFNDEDAAKAVAKYRERYFNEGWVEQHLYEGVLDFLGEIRRRGYVMGIATSKMQIQADRVADEFGLREYFDFIAGRDDAGTLHTKADVINAGLAAQGITDRSKILMIGDRKFDIIGAKECNIDSMAVLYGYGDRDEFEKAGANYICTDFTEILSLLIGDGYQPTATSHIQDLANACRTL